MIRLRSAKDCARQIEAVWGAEPGEGASTLHVGAVWADPSGGLKTLRIGPETPRSPYDRFALGLARARCDAILTTGRILREEPSLLHRYLDDEEGERALAQWRLETSGRPARPESVVLTSGRAIDFGHPIFRDGAPVTIFCGEESAQRLRRVAPDGVNVVAHPEPGPHSAIAFLLGRGGRVVSVEAGATTTRALYKPPIAVEEILLSTFRGECVAASVLGPAFPATSLLGTAFERIAVADIEEPSGPWRFARYRRR